MLSALECHVHSLAPIECHYTCLWHRSRSRALRHAEDEENDDGWIDVLLTAPVAFASSCGYGAFFQGDP